MTNRRHALASGLETLSPRADGATHQPVTTTLSTAVSAVRYPSSPSVTLNRPAVTIQRVAQHSVRLLARILRRPRLRAQRLRRSDREDLEMRELSSIRERSRRILLHPRARVAHVRAAYLAIGGCVPEQTERSQCAREVP